MGEKPILCNRGQVGCQIDAFVLQAQLFADVVPVKINGAGGQAHQIGDFLGGLALPDQVGDLGFRRGEPGKLNGQFSGQG